MKRPPLRSTKSFYDLAIQATYGGVRYRHTFTISIVEAVRITSIQLLGQSVPDGSPAGTVVGTLSATGTALPANGTGITYRITGGDTNPSTFSIDGNQLKLARRPSRALKATYDLTLTASYRSVTSAPVGFTIRITEAVSITAISLTGTRQLAHNAPVGTKVGDLIAMGTGLPADGAGITYSIASSNALGYFRVNGSAIEVAKTLLIGEHHLTFNANYTGVSYTTTTATTIQVLGTGITPIRAFTFAPSFDVPFGNGLHGLYQNKKGHLGYLDASAQGQTLTYTLMSQQNKLGSAVSIFTLNGKELRVANTASIADDETYTLVLKTAYNTNANAEIAATLRLRWKALSPPPQPINFEVMPENGLSQKSHTDFDIQANTTGKLAALRASAPNDEPLTYTIKRQSANEQNVKVFAIENHNELHVKASLGQSNTTYTLVMTITYTRTNALGFIESGSSEVTITLHVVQASITSIFLSGNKQVLDGASPGTVVGTLSATGTGLPADGSGIAYRITAGDISPSTFVIDGSTLKVIRPPVQSVKSAYQLDITAHYGSLTSAPVRFTITITKSPNLLLTPFRSVLNIYPNPAKDKVRIVGLKSGEHLRVLDTKGNVVLVRPAAQYIDLSHLPTGLYILEVIGNHHPTLRRRLLKGP